MKSSAVSQSREVSATPTATVDKALSPLQIDEARAERVRLTLRLENAQEQLAKRQDQLSRVCAAEQNATRLLSLTKADDRYRSERARAEEVLERCASRKRELEPLIESTRKLVSQIRGDLAKIPSIALRQVDDIAALARQLSSPLP